ncbi:hypothetical protein LIER_17335 [Lithospermum erythrorhizon]|uniref:LDLR chaperone MESD n=1 Tax=Lithospermum erythrorhizon TaxID=34254 RepID=A0AAV3QFD6_LITER
MSKNTTFLVTLSLLLLIAQQSLAGKTKIHIPDELDDVVDDEEDEAWKEWGKKKSSSEFDPPPDFTKLNPEQIQAEMMKRQFGPVFGFAKLQPGVKRTKEMVSEIAMKWTKIARTGAIEAKFMGFDLNTVMVTMERGQDAIELKEFLLDQADAYEIKIGEQVFRREGDPPLEEVTEKLRGRSDNGDKASPKDDHSHQEL